MFLLAFYQAKAQSLQIIKGQTIDKQSKKPLVGITVSLSSVNPSITTQTDSTGKFRLVGVPLGRHDLLFRLVGYKQTTVNEVLISAGKETELSVEMEPSTNTLSEVAIVGGKSKRPLNEMATVSARSFSAEETSRYAAALFDPARMAQSFAGVTASTDNNNIVIRGNAPKSVLWRLEGIEIINPNHFGMS